MHRTEIVRPRRIDQRELIAERLRAQERAEVVEAVIAVAGLVTILAMLAGWTFPV